jgi:hypothetical protein
VRARGRAGSGHIDSFRQGQPSPSHDKPSTSNMKRHGDTRCLVQMRYLTVAIVCTLLIPCMCYRQCKNVVMGFQLQPLSVTTSTRPSKLRTWSGVRNNDQRVRFMGPSPSTVSNTKHYVAISNTQLCMGLRSFLRNRKSKNEGEEGSAQGQGDASQGEGRIPPNNFDLPPPPPGKSEDYFKTPAIFQRKQRNEAAREDENAGQNAYYGETVQDRMRRMSTGEMTAEEKEAFLDRALTWSAAKEPHKNKKTIRQSLPLGGVPVKLYGENDADAQANNSAPSISGKSSGTSAETSWSHVVSAKRQEQQDRYGASSPIAGGVPLMDDAAKEAWLNMVTSPTRFQGYSAVQPASKQASDMETDAPQTQPVTKQQLKDLSEAKRRLMEQQKLFSEMAQGSKTSGEKLLESSPFLPRGAGSILSDDGEEQEENSEEKDDDDVSVEELSVPPAASPPTSSSAAETIEVVTSSSEQPKNGTNELGARLEQAAMIQEKKDREAREAMQQENERIQKEEQRRLMERQRESQRLSEEQESLKLRRRVEEEKKLAQAEQKQRSMETEKRKQLEEVQMSYWSRKLAEEQAAKDDRSSQSGSSEQDNAQAVRLAKEKEANRIRMRQVQIEDERDLLQKVSGLVSPRCPSIALEHHNGNLFAFVFFALRKLTTYLFQICQAAQQRDQSRARAQIITDITAAKLAPGGRVPASSSRGADSFIKSQAARKDALKRFTQDQQSHLRDLNSLNQPPPQPRAAAPPPPITNRTVGGGGSQLPRPLPRRDDSMPRPGPTPSPTGISVGDLMSGRVRDDDEALNQFKDLDEEGKDMSEEDARQGIMDTLARSKATAKPPPQRSGQPIRQQVSIPSQPQQRTGPVRQKLPMVEANETDVIRPSSSPAPKQTNSSIDISDSDKKRANKWGINLDKLL